MKKGKKGKQWKESNYSIGNASEHSRNKKLQIPRNIRSGYHQTNKEMNASE